MEIEITEKTKCAHCGETLRIGDTAYIISDETVCSPRCGKLNDGFRAAELAADRKFALIESH